MGGGTDLLFAEVRIPKPLHKTYSIGRTSGPVAQWIRHRPTEPGIAGSSPAGVILLYIRYPPLFLITMDTRLGVGHCIGSQSC